MARQLRMQFPGAFYHVTSRGNEKRTVFTDNQGRERFLAYLESAVERYGAVIHVWCLMGNHYHLFLETPRGNLSQIMRHINGAYTTYFNARHKRSGHLFQGRYKAIIVEADSYALELSRYIHLNPVRAQLTAKPEEYSWSSYRSYIGEETARPWLTTTRILDYFNNSQLSRRGTYRKFVEDLLTAEYSSPLQATIASTLLGSPRFVKEISHAHLGQTTDARNLPASRTLHQQPTIREILKVVDSQFGQGTQSRNFAIYCCHRYSGAKLREIGAQFGISDAAVSQASRRLQQKAATDPALQQLLEWVKSQLLAGDQNLRISQ